MAVTADLEFTEVNVAPVLAVQLPRNCAPDPPSINAAMHEAFESLMSFVTRHHLIPNGQPRAIYNSYSPAGVSFIVAVPVTSAPSKPIDEMPFQVDTLPAFSAYRFTHHGPYPELAQTYNRITIFMKEKGWMTSEADWERYMPMWEEYRNDPRTTAPADLITYIYLPAAGQSRAKGAGSAIV